MPLAPPTEQGRVSRARIVHAAAGLVARRGVAVTIDDVRAEAKASKSQVYHYFGDKQGLLRAVVEDQAGMVVRTQQEWLGVVSTYDDLVAWSNKMVASLDRRQGRFACPIGTLAVMLGELDEDCRARLAEAFEDWRVAIADALQRLRANGDLGSGVDIEELASVGLAAIQGGQIVSTTTRSREPLRVALDSVLRQVRSTADRSCGAVA